MKAAVSLRQRGDSGLARASAVYQSFFTEVHDGNAGPRHGGQAFDSAEERFAQDDGLFGLRMTASIDRTSEIGH